MRQTKLNKSFYLDCRILFNLFKYFFFAVPRLYIFYILSFLFLYVCNIFNQLHVFFPTLRTLTQIYHNCFAVCSALNTTLDNIAFPVTADDLRCTKSSFYDSVNPPNCVGALDGSVIPII